MGCGSSSAQGTSGQRHTTKQESTNQTTPYRTTNNEEPISYHQTRKKTGTTKDTAKYPEPTKVTAKSQALTMETAKSQALNIETAKSQALTIETAKSQALTIETAKSQALTIGTVKSQALTNETAKSHALTIETAKYPEPTKETAKSHALTQETANSQTPTIETAKYPEPIKETAMSPELAKETARSQEPTNETAKSPKPTKATVKLSGSSFVDAAINVHNHYRSKHGAPPLRRAKDLTQYSQNWANDIASRDTMEHSKCTLPSGGRIGENIYYYWSSEGATIRDSSAKDAVDAWYNEIKDYNFRSSGFKPGTGHFTQVVWKGSRELGIAAATSKSGSVYVVANYRPAGNMMGDFPGNVLPLGTPVTDPGPTDNKAGSGGGHKKSSGRSFIDTAVQAHNKYRSDHDAPPMRAADDLTKYSQKWADDIARRDTMEHSNCTLTSGGRVGENIYSYWSSLGAEISDSQGHSSQRPLPSTSLVSGHPGVTTLTSALLNPINTHSRRHHTPYRW